MTTDLAQMQTLTQFYGSNTPVTIVYLRAEGDYWIEQEKFCEEFRSAPLDHNVVIHVKFEGLSLTHSLVVPTVRKIMEETGRKDESVFVFSPNAIESDSPWRNVFWKQYKVSDEFSRSLTYWPTARMKAGDMSQPDEPREDFKTWALFVGRRTTPRLLALYDLYQNPLTRNNTILSIMNHPSPDQTQIFDRPGKIYDTLEEWLPPINSQMQKILQQSNFRNFCQNIPFGSVDGYSITDQYVNTDSNENRNGTPMESLVSLSGRYLFEITLETMTRGFTFTPTEKTVRTIVAKKPFLVYAPPNFLSHMRSIGFETFSRLWDESYDQLEGPGRYRAMLKIIQDVCNMPREQQWEMYENSKEICAHNREILRQYIINNRPRR